MDCEVQVKPLIGAIIGLANFILTLALPLRADNCGAFKTMAALGWLAYFSSKMVSVYDQKSDEKEDR